MSRGASNAAHRDRRRLDLGSWRYSGVTSCGGGRASAWRPPALRARQRLRVFVSSASGSRIVEVPQRPAGAPRCGRSLRCAGGSELLGTTRSGRDALVLASQARGSAVRARHRPCGSGSRLVAPLAAAPAAPAVADPRAARGGGRKRRSRRGAPAAAAAAVQRRAAPQRRPVARRVGTYTRPRGR
jgi:hypothetical protein